MQLVLVWLEMRQHSVSWALVSYVSYMYVGSVLVNTCVPVVRVLCTH